MADAEAICRAILNIMTAPEQSTCFQTDSFGYFVQSGIQRVFNDLRDIVYVDWCPDALDTHLCIKMHNAQVNPPKRGQDHAYCHMQSFVSELQCDILMSIGDGSESKVMQTEIKNHVIGILPVMVGSKLAPDGPTHLPLKGHFIINGRDKVLVAQQRVINNHALLYRNTSASDCVQHICQVRSTICDDTRVPLIIFAKMNMRNHQPSPITVSVRFFRNEVPFMYKFLALGCCNINQIMKLIHTAVGNMQLHIDVDHLLLPSALDGPALMHSDDGTPSEQWTCQLVIHMCRFMQSKTLSPMRCTIEHVTANLLPHLHEHGLKAEYLEYMTALVLSSADGYAKQHTHRDSQINKRIEMPHVLLMHQLRACLLKQRNNFGQNVAKGRSDNRQTLWKCVHDWHADPQVQKLNDICDLLLSMIRTHNMTRQMMNAMVTGNWVTHASIAESMHYQNSCRTGVVQLLQKYNFTGSISHLRRINTPPEKLGRASKPWLLHPSTMGFLCPVETPEGSICGLLCSGALGATVCLDLSVEQKATALQHVKEELANLLCPLHSDTVAP